MVGFSWADEVEREEEEEEEARAQWKEHQKKPNNPFGSARPREVVLQEKGIDWRKIDQKFHEPSTLRKEKQMKENIPAEMTQASEKQHIPSMTRVPEGNVRNTRNVYEENGISTGSLTSRNQDLDPLVPPLRYPPKNYMYLINAMQQSNNFHRAETRIPNVGEFDRQRANRIGERGDSIDFQSPDFYRQLGAPESRMDRGRRCPSSEIGRKDLNSMELRHHAVGKMHDNVRPMRTSPIRGEREWNNKNPNHIRNTFIEEQLVGHPPVNGRRSSLPDHNRGGRVSDEDFYHGNMETEYGRTNIIAATRRGRSPIESSRHRGGLDYHGFDKGEAGFRGNYRTARVRPLEDAEHRRENAEYLYDRQRFGVEEFEGHRTRTMDGRRAEQYNKLDTKTTSFRNENNRKRAMKLGPINHRVESTEEELSPSLKHFCSLLFSNVSRKHVMRILHEPFSFFSF